MSDKLIKLNKVNFTFTNGENVLPSKLTALAAQNKNAFSTIEKALGDLWNDNFPYFESSSNLVQKGSFDIETGTSLGQDRYLDILSIARLIGPSSNLNPIHLSDISDSEKTVIETLPSSGNVYILSYVPDFDESFTVSGTSVLTTRVASSALNAAGEYYISNLGELITYSTMDGGTIEYTIDFDNAVNCIADFYKSSYNVIPDPNQAQKCTLTGPDGSGYYTLTLPVAEEQLINDAGDSSSLTDEDLNFEVQLKLPTVLSELSNGDSIPDNFLLLKNETDNEIYKNLSFVYVNQYQVKITGATLDTADDYSIITVGANITQTLYDLKFKLWQLRRAKDSAAAIDSSHLVNKTGKGIDELYVPSEVNFNYFPQYLHRDGYFPSDDDNNINDQNGLRGDLLLLASARSGTSRNHLSNSSVKLRFGSYSSGPYMNFHYGSSATWLGVFKNTTSGVYTDGKMLTEGGIVAGATLQVNGTFGSNWGPFKIVYDSFNFTFAGGAPETKALTAAITTALSGKTVVGLLIQAKPSAVSYYWAPGDARGGNSGYDARLDAITSPTSIIFGTAGSDWTAGTNVMKVVLFYID